MNYIDFEKMKPYIKEEFTKVFGEEYKEIINERTKRTVLLQYNNVAGIQSYVNYLESKKCKEITIEFLNKNGVDINKNEEFIRKLNAEIYYAIKFGCLRDKSRLETEKISYRRINAWREIEIKTDSNIKVVEENKIEFINYLRGEKKEKITKETFKDFCETDEYKEILEKIEEYLRIYDKIQESYEQIKDELEEYKKAPYQKYIDDEEKRKKDIQTSKINSLYEQIEDDLPEAVRDCLDKKYSSKEEKIEAILEKNLGIKTYVEYFSQEDEKNLNEGQDEDLKLIIQIFRLNYLKSVGAIDDQEIKDKNCKEAYEYAINKKDIQKFILKQDVIEKITKLREKLYEEQEKDFIYGSDDFKRIKKNLNGEQEFIEKWIYEEIKKKDVCLSCVDSTDDEGKHLRTIYFTIRKSEVNVLDYIILHEMCHGEETERIQDNLFYCGFEHDSFRGKSVDGANPYNEKWRKYEKLNEVITDIFAIEAMEYLHEKGIYLLDKKDETDKYFWTSVSLEEEIQNHNTDSILKQMVLPFLNKYREHIIKARMYGDRNIMYEVFGEQNFEELNDIVNKVESLLSQGLRKELEEQNSENSMVIEYNEQLKRLEQVYANMEEYKKEDINNDILLKSAIDTTKDVTREGQINEAISNITQLANQHEKEIDVEH